ncbi:MAG: response regulator [Planctomycetota bacterium]|nr:response regulator [Planctomycetota bacterium]
MARIVMIDDDPDFLEIQKGVLESQGHTVVTVDNSKEAVEKTRETNPDLVIVDLMMEEEDTGFSLCYQFKKGATGKKLPVIMVTGVASERGVPFNLDGPETGGWIKADIYLNKPIRPEELISAVDKLSK